MGSRFIYSYGHPGSAWQKGPVARAGIYRQRAARLRRFDRITRAVGLVTDHSSPHSTDRGALSRDPARAPWEHPTCYFADGQFRPCQALRKVVESDEACAAIL